MYNSKNDENLKDDDANAHSSNTPNKNLVTYRDEFYDEDDFYGQIMRSASRNNPNRAQEQSFESQEVAPLKSDGIKEQSITMPTSNVSLTDNHASSSNTQSQSLQRKTLSRRARQKALNDTQKSILPQEDVHANMQQAPLSEDAQLPRMTLIEEVEAQRKAKQQGTTKKKTKKKLKKEKKTNSNQYKTFVKQNLCIFIYALINSFVLCLLLLYILDTQVLSSYTITLFSQKAPWTLCLIIAPLMAYQVAGFHCGMFMLKNKLKNMKLIFKIMLSPILFLVYEVLGILCEIPYLIFAMISMKNK